MTGHEGRAQEHGIVDQQDAALARSEQADGDEARDRPEPPASTAERAGIVDQQDAALERSKSSTEE